MSNYNWSEMNRIELEEMAQALLDEARASAKVILMLDEILTKQKQQTQLAKNLLKFRHNVVNRK